MVEKGQPKPRKLSRSELVAIVGERGPNGLVISGRIVTTEYGTTILEYWVLPDPEGFFASLRKILGFTEMNSKRLT